MDPYLSFNDISRKPGFTGIIALLLVFQLAITPVGGGTLNELDTDPSKPDGLVKYVVKSGDCLSLIARKVLNDATLWPRLASYNGLANPNLIFPGQLISIPIDWFAAAGSSAGTSTTVVTPPVVAGNTGNTGNAGSTGSTGSTGSNGGTTGTAGPAPDFKDPSFPAGEVTAGSADFNKWVDSGIAATDSSKVPELTDVYGKKVEKDDIIKAIVMIESSGRHTKNGKVIENAWGFTGFMQLSKGFGDGRFDPSRNIAMGTNYLLSTCMKSASPPAGKNKTYNEADNLAERLVKAAAGYNRGPYATANNISSKLKSGEKALDSPWKDVVTSIDPKGKSYMHEGVHYGIKFKACLGLSLTTSEREWMKSYRGYSDAQFDSWKDKLYSDVHNI
ncbi:MAG: hypothetical protein CVV64_13210 [Candidatus Wallbacteria bacterium HGW-Wallbacteria-1]|jgi:LysM repeat protein|uniref:LysM domain-containing protein n=1 Tax=Candidatus Wallbacteria bacterium HGW-Wallbacteria-1 TaxID=2013854 RepID=A0A2N1PMQ6_9BACT|nr:MAG: hypothetical protein CVV64_13210 [Candidatus Wallbacteria bacterium HGW-Wallbacteria-1]